MCEPDVPIESVVMAHSLVNSAPLIAGMTDPEARRKLARYVYKISRGLIGQDVAKELMYPDYSSFGAVGWFKFQQRYGSILGKLFRGRARSENYTRFTFLLHASAYDDTGISYRLPSHVYSEESKKW